MKVAGIDIGTNSMRLLLTDFFSQADGQSEFRDRSKEVKITRMGKGVDADRIIEPETFRYNIDSFEEFVEKARNKKAERIFAIGTSALRDAKNGEEFVAAAERSTGVKIDIISGNLEAELGFYGVSQGVKEKGRILILDIGGGSTEFVIGSQIEGIVFKKSIDIGAVRLTDNFGDDLHDMTGFILSQVEDLHDLIERYAIRQIVGIGGTIGTVSAINLCLTRYDPDRVHNSRISLEEVECILRSLSSLSLEDRKKVVGLQPERADIIVAGVNILLGIMNKLRIKAITVSEYDNLEGLVYYYLRNE
ncbi:MAG: Ppx/GppA phosphatase family protein [Peptostreptococcaceae bacterium]|nr:Ppx/GppA phosphatase family protein [Peptostreptococcaceae bacterium]